MWTKLNLFETFNQLINRRNESDKDSELSKIYGYKIKYKNPDEKIKAEFSIYNEKFKDIVVHEHTRKFVLPFYVTFMLYILKFFYYTIPILPKSAYSELKRFVLHTCLGEDYPKFMVLDS